MKLLTIDFETYYDKDFSLSKITTEEYIRSEQFETIGVAVKEDSGETKWYTGTFSEIRKALKQYDWEDSGCLAHNAMFDSAILTWLFGIKPKMWFDTMSMGRALIGSFHSVSLANMSKYYKVGEKGTEVLNALGKRRLDFTEEELERYAQYCINDVELTYVLFSKIVKGFPQSELRLIDLTIKMFSEPILEIDEGLLKKELKNIEEKKQSLLNQSGMDSKTLASNKKFAEFLESKGVKVPMKISPRTGKPTYALAKSDEGFKELLDHEDETIQIVASARKNIKSTINQTRIERFLSIAERGSLPVPLRYYAAHTGRWGGADKVNLQNLPKNKMREGIIVPSGHTLIDADSSQIEARVLCWFAGQEDMLNAFRTGQDNYKIMASKIYGKKVEDVTPAERFIGKTCVLGCGYQMSYSKFQGTIKNAGVDMTEEECKKIVYAYRDSASHIARLWYEGQELLKSLCRGQVSAFGKEGIAVAFPDSIQLPNNMFIHYKNLQSHIVDGKNEITYRGRGGESKYIYGGKLTENVVQGLARILIADQMLLIAKKYKVVFTVHDAVACVVPVEETERAMEYVRECMSFVPSWAKGLPLTCEVGCGKSYGGISK